VNSSVTMERPLNENKLPKAHKSFHAAIVAAATGKRIVIPPADNTSDQLLRVLIVDNHRAMTDTLSSLVTIWGHNVRRAYDGVTGLALAAAFRPNVLLLDMLMPGMNGFEVAMQVRRQVRLQHCFIIAITGRTDAKHRSRCYETGVDLFLIKPVAPSDMQTLLSLEVKHVRDLRSRVTVSTACHELAATY
jgi:CheY-like chemotaxis protein